VARRHEGVEVHEEQIAFARMQAESGTTVEESCRKRGITAKSRSTFGAMTLAGLPADARAVHPFMAGNDSAKEAHLQQQ